MNVGSVELVPLVDAVGLVDRNLLVVCGHYPAGGIGRVVTRGGRVVWEAA